MISETTLRLMLSYLEIDELGIDSVHRILKGMSRDDAVGTIWTLLALMFPEIDVDGRAAWESWLQDGIAGEPIGAVPDHVPDFKRER